MSDRQHATTATTTPEPVIGSSDGLHLVTRDETPLDGAVTAVHGEGSELWALVRRSDLYRVADGRAELAARLGDGATGTCLCRHRGVTWVGGDDARVWRLDGSELVEVDTFLDAPGRDDWHTPWGGPPSVFSMASSGDDLYVSVHVGGILRTADGTSWAPTIDLHDDVHQVAVDADGTLFAATGMRALASSDDRGATWSYHHDGLHGRYLLAVAATSDGVLVGASSGHSARNGAIYRFDGARFTRPTGLPDEFDGAVGPRRLAAAGDDAIVALPNGDVHVSHDGGRTWSPLLAGVRDIGEVALVDRNRARTGE